MGEVVIDAVKSVGPSELAPGPPAVKVPGSMWSSGVTHGCLVAGCSDIFFYFLGFL
jgi:hypothetical protein